MPDVLVVDDDDASRAVLRTGLELCGHRVHAIALSADAVQSATRLEAQVIVLVAGSLRAPAVLCRATRALPVLVILRSTEEWARVEAFQAGADDVVVHPFSMRELCLRLRVLAERPRTRQSAFKYGLLTLELSARRVFVAGAEVVLTRREFAVLARLCAESARTVSRNTLLDHVWGANIDVDVRIVDAHVSRIRVKLGPAGRYIRSVHGVGYILDSFGRSTT